MTHPSNYLYAKEGQLRENDWVLLFKLPGVTWMEWMYVDVVIPMSKEDEAFDEDFSFQAVQASPPNLVARAMIGPCPSRSRTRRKSSPCET